MLARLPATSNSSARAASSSQASSRAVGGPSAPQEAEVSAASVDMWSEGAAKTAAAPSFNLGVSTLRNGARGASVQALQQALNHYGARLKADGVFGPVTHAAVVAFQKANGLKPDGVVGPVTRGVIQGGHAKSVGGPAPAPSSPAQAPSTPASTSGMGTASLALGAKGASVVALQQALNQYGAKLKADGDFGPVTQRAVVEFQKANGLKPDGIVGAVTRGVLTSGRAKSVAAAVGAQTPTQAPAPVSSGPVLTPPAVLAALGWARTQQNAPYFGGASPYRYGQAPGDGGTYQMKGQKPYVSTKGVIGYDCSGFVLAVMKKAGINLQLYSSTQMLSLPKVGKEQIQPGDLLVKSGHVAIYLGDGMKVESKPSGVGISFADEYLKNSQYTVHRPW